MKRLLGFWALVNALLWGGIIWLQRPELPQPFFLTRITIGEVVLEQSAWLGGQWQLNGQNVNHDWVQSLRSIVGRECVWVMPEEAFDLPRHNPRHFQLNEHQYTITSHNTYLQAHYVHHNGAVYLCHERLKSLIATPQERWLQ